MSDSKIAVKNPDVINAINQNDEQHLIAKRAADATAVRDAYMNEPVRYSSLQLVDLAVEGASITDSYRNIRFSKSIRAAGI